MVPDVPAICSCILKSLHTGAGLGRLPPAGNSREQASCKACQISRFLHDLQGSYEPLLIIGRHLPCSQSISLALQFQLVRSYELKGREREEEYSHLTLAFNTVKSAPHLVQARADKQGCRKTYRTILTRGVPREFQLGLAGQIVLACRNLFVDGLLFIHRIFPGYKENGLNNI